MNGLSVFRLHIEAGQGHTNDLSRLSNICYSTEVDFGTTKSMDSRLSDATIIVRLKADGRGPSLGRDSAPGMVSGDVYERI